MNTSEGERPAKRAKVEASENNSGGQAKSKQPRKWRTQQAEFRRQQRRADLDHPQPETAEHRRDRELFGIDEDNEQELSLKPLQDKEREELRKRHAPKMFSQPSVMAPGDRGIFVTCDKGKEKKCLTDLADLVQEYLEKVEIIPAELVDPDALLESRVERQQKKTATVPVDNEPSPVEEEEIDIESSINAELSGYNKGVPVNVRAFQLITLDIPCVSFLRFIPNGIAYDKVDVVELVQTLCIEAASNPGRMRSRFIKRLSPVVWLGKILSDGLKKACEKALPSHFKIESQGSDEKSGTEMAQGVTFAIRPTIRNNDKVSRDDVIREVAEEVQRLGNGKHKVDLKGYQKGVLIEIYRGWVGMSVVDNNNPGRNREQENEAQIPAKLGYEALKRFNLSEIYAEGLKEQHNKASGEAAGKA